MSVMLATSEGQVVTSRFRYRVVPATRAHAFALSERMRPGDVEEAKAQGHGPYMALSRTLRASLWADTAIVDGEVAAMWGLAGMALDDVGTPWLVTSALVERLPVAVVKEAKKAVQKMLEFRPVLSNHVLASYTQAVRLLEVIGFTLDEPQPYGPQGILFRRFHMERH